MFAGFNQRLKGGLGRLQQGFVAGALTYLIRGPDGANWSLVSGKSGALNLVGSDSTTGTAGAVNITGGAGVTGGPVNITAGSGTSGVGGTLTLSGGASGSSSAGPVVVKGATGNSTATAGASATLLGGQAASAVNAVGGNALVEGGPGGNGGRGGHAILRPGIGFGTPVRGHCWLDGGQGAALSTSETGGMVLFPSMPGSPSGTPANVPSGSVATVIDTTNLRIYCYIAGTWRYAQLI